MSNPLGENIVEACIKILKQMKQIMSLSQKILTISLMYAEAEEEGS